MRLAETVALRLMASEDVRKVSARVQASAASQTTHPRAALHSVDELLGLTAGVLPGRATRQLESARERLREERCNVVVLGEFKRGKSTLLNALLQRDVLPTGVLPLTSAVTVIRHGGAERLLVRLVNGHVDERPLEEVAHYATEAGNPGNYRQVELVVIELPHELLAGGLQLVDTPGIGSVHGHNSQAAHDFLAEVDAAVCVLGADQPLSEAERRFFEQAAAHAPRLLFVVNKIDLLGAGERNASLEFVRAGVGGLNGADPDLVAVSARSGEGLEALAERLRAVGGNDRRSLLERSVRRLVVGLAREAAGVAELERKAIELPLEDLRARRERFEERIVALRTARDEAGSVLRAGVERLLEQDVNRPLQELAASRSEQLRQDVREAARARTGLSPRELGAQLNGWIDERIRHDFSALAARVERHVADRLGELERLHVERVDEILAGVERAAEDVFGSAGRRVVGELGLRDPTRFRFKLSDPEHMLGQLLSAGRVITPGRLGRRLVLRDAEDRLLQMTDRHAGRLRSELVERTWEAVSAFERDLAATVDEAIDAIDTAVARALVEHEQGQARMRDRLGQLAHREARLRELAARTEEVGRREG